MIPYHWTFNELELPQGRQFIYKFYFYLVYYMKINPTENNHKTEPRESKMLIQKYETHIPFAQMYKHTKSTKKCIKIYQKNICNF